MSTVVVIAKSRRKLGFMDLSIKPPFTLEKALAKVKAAEDAWNSRDPERVALAYTEDSDLLVYSSRAELIFPSAQAEDSMLC
jgi:nuclear transport factor 2 (NTF2) superfamily protein